MMIKIKDYLKNKLPFLYKILRYVNTFFLAELKNIIIYRELDPKTYFISHKHKLIYIVNSKAACSSIKKSILNIDIPDDYSIHKHGLTKKKLSPEENKYFKFSFVRNPFERIVSCYLSKYMNDKKIIKTKELHFDYYLLGVLKKQRGFNHFIDTISKIPFFLSDRHFKPQYKLLFSKNKIIVDYVGKLEDINNSYSQLQKKFDISSLGNMNSSNKGDWRRYYTKESAKKIYKKYKKDFETWYPDSYKELMTYLENK